MVDIPISDLLVYSISPNPLSLLVDYQRFSILLQKGSRMVHNAHLSEGNTHIRKKQAATISISICETKTLMKTKETHSLTGGKEPFSPGDGHHSRTI